MNKTMQNITLSLPRATLRKVRLIAVQRETSISRLLADILEDLVEFESAYPTAHKSHLQLLGEGFDLGTHGDISWTREEIHER